MTEPRTKAGRHVQRQLEYLSLAPENEIRRDILAIEREAAELIATELSSALAENTRLIAENDRLRVAVPDKREQARERVIAAAREAARGAIGYEALDLRDALAALDRLSEPKP